MLDKRVKPKAGCHNKGLALGRQLTIEYYECGIGVLLNSDRVENILLKAAKESGANIISSSFHQFEPQGVSGVVIIAESHFTVHAWPEHDYAAVDIFTCGDSINIDTAINSMKDSFESGRMEISSDQNRGIFSRVLESGPQNLKTSEMLPISWKNAHETKKPWGVLTSVDIHGCDPSTIMEACMIEKFVSDLCERLKLKPLAGCKITELTENDRTQGLRMTQDMDSSFVSAHFMSPNNTAYIDLFSRKFYEPRMVGEFAMSFFKGKDYAIQVAMRQ